MTRPIRRRKAAGEQSLKQMASDIISAAKGAVPFDPMPDNFDELLDEIIDRGIPNFARSLHASLLEDKASFVAWRRRHDAGFRRRNVKRWQPALDILEAEWAVAQEANACFFADERTEAIKGDDNLFVALTNLHARALLVTREAICLLEGGFPDGAMSRWRTLHELNVVAHFLLLHSDDVARLYLDSATFQALKHAKQAQQYAAQDPTAAISAEVVTSLERRCAELRLKIGMDLSDDYAWAAPTLAKKRPNFFDIEEATGRTFWRPRFRWASQHIHGAYVKSRGMLAMAEASQNVAMLVGPSNGGMVDPMQMIAHSLADVSEALLSSKPDIIRKIAISVLWMFADEVGPTAMECQENFRLRHDYDPEK